MNNYLLIKTIKLPYTFVSFDRFKNHNTLSQTPCPQCPRNHSLSHKQVNTQNFSPMRSRTWFIKTPNKNRDESPISSVSGPSFHQTSSSSSIWHTQFDNHNRSVNESCISVLQSVATWRERERGCIALLRKWFWTQVVVSVLGVSVSGEGGGLSVDTGRGRMCSSSA